jgi:hypothetical protein
LLFESLISSALFAAPAVQLNVPGQDGSDPTESNTSKKLTCFQSTIDVAMQKCLQLSVGKTCRKYPMPQKPKITRQLRLLTIFQIYSAV